MSCVDVLNALKEKADGCDAVLISNMMLKEAVGEEPSEYIKELEENGSILRIDHDHKLGYLFDRNLLSKCAWEMDNRFFRVMTNNLYEGRKRMMMFSNPYYNWYKKAWGN